MSNSLHTLISKLTETSRRAAVRAASLTMSRGHYEVDLEHLFLALLEEAGSDFVVLCRRFEVPAGALQSDLEREMGRFKTGNTRTPVFSPRLASLLEHAWLSASLESQQASGVGLIRSAHLLLAMLTEPSLSQLAFRGSKLFIKFNLDDIKLKMVEATEGSNEGSDSVVNLSTAAVSADVTADEHPTASASGKTPALDQFTSNLTQRAALGKLDPVIGRDAEIRQVIDILMRRRQNNPILTGEAGVGKTAVAEGLALRIAANDVPPPLQGVELHVLDMGLLQAGASVKGEFENRLKNVIEEVKKSPHPIILFIDEAHTLIGAGGQAGQGDAANLLKPALARGELRTVAATTWSEYKKYFEKDAALARRFQVVKVEEPTEAVAAAMLRGVAPLMEKHFKVRVFDEAILEAVRLSARYISGRQLPDKAIGVLDTACAKVALGQTAVPAALEDNRKWLERLAAEISALEREQISGAAHKPKLTELCAQRDGLQKDGAVLLKRFEAERRLVDEIQRLRSELEAMPAKALTAGQTALRAKQDELTRLQGEAPLIPMQVDGLVIAEVVAAWTGVPLGKMVKDEIKTVLNLKSLLSERVLGQAHALDAVAQRVRTARANLEDPNKPKGVFLFVGPSGVGKTETALALADVLYGGERKLISINMSEYQEAHSVSGLKGSPPGYVGYGEGGVLTEAVRRNAHSVLLLDEVEKAHPDVLELFFQVFDKGVLDDAEGREIDFRNTIIILTSNVGAHEIVQACAEQTAIAALDKLDDEIRFAKRLDERLRPVLYKSFKPAFLGRLKVVPYRPIADDVLAQIIRLKLDRIAQRLAVNHKAAFEYDGKLVDAVLARCTEVDSGARNVDNILTGTLLPNIAEQVLTRMADGKAIVKIKASAAKNGDFKYSVT